MLTNIKVEMVKANITNSEIAGFLEISPNTFSFKLNQKREFTLSEILKLALYFDCSVDYLAGLTNQRESLQKVS